ncbi:hypothetical protein FQZ97_832220 [compost metagenome]
MSGIDEVDNAYVGFARMLAVQSTGILLKVAFPGNRHGQDQGIQWWMVEAFTDQLAGSQEYSWGIGW